MLKETLLAVRLQVVVLFIEVLLVLVDGFGDLVINADGIVDKVFAFGLEIIKGLDPVLLGLGGGLDRADDLAQIAYAAVNLVCFFCKSESSDLNFSTDCFAALIRLGIWLILPE